MLGNQLATLRAHAQALQRTQGGLKGLVPGLLGSLWTKLHADGEPAEDSIVTRQCVLALFTALDKLRLAYEHDAAQASAETSFAAMQRAAAVGPSAPY